VRAVDAGERVISLEAEMREVRRILERIAAKLDQRPSKAMFRTNASGRAVN
jgi:hypothetical protein